MTGDVIAWVSTVLAQVWSVNQSLYY